MKLHLSKSRHSKKFKVHGFERGIFRSIRQGAQKITDITQVHRVDPSSDTKSYVVHASEVIWAERLSNVAMS